MLIGENCRQLSETDALARWQMIYNPVWWGWMKELMRAELAKHPGAKSIVYEIGGHAMGGIVLAD